MSGDQIRCPKCWIRPSSGNNWCCDGCGNAFDTFESKGTCPACGKQYEQTQCLSCNEWSPHSEWYQCIRCPKCTLHPCQDGKWHCKCGHCWNTFDTRGRCPACEHQWMETECLSCGQSSPHLDWYYGH